MRWHRIFMLRLSSLFRREEADSELQSELEDHLRQEVEANMVAGMDAEEARYAAQRSLGSVALYQEECRDARGTAVFDTLARDRALAGTAATLAAARLLSALLYGISPRYPPTYTLALLLMAAIAILAVWHPARRAIRIDPARTLRGE